VNENRPIANLQSMFWEVGMPRENFLSPEILRVTGTKVCGIARTARIRTLDLRRGKLSRYGRVNLIVTGPVSSTTL